MASTNRTYADPSALLKLYIHEPASAAMNVWRRRTKGALPMTPHGRLEIANGICLAAFRKVINAEALSDDVLHVATAVELGLRYFVTFDSRQRQLARAAGLKPVTPSV